MHKLKHKLANDLPNTVTFLKATVTALHSFFFINNSKNKQPPQNCLKI